MSRHEASCSCGQLRAIAEGDPVRVCGRCGSTVFYDFGAEVDIVVIPVGAFADPAFPAPSRMIYEDRRHPWVTIAGEAIDPAG